MTTLSITPQDAPGRPWERTPTRKWGRPLSASETAYEMIRSEWRLTPFEKLILSILLEYCQAEGNCLCFPSTLKLASTAGVDHTIDRGEARVNRALAKLQRIGILDRISRYEMADWMREVGVPKLGLSMPRPEGDPPRYLLLWWKVPGLVEGMAVALKNRSSPGASDRVDRRPPGAGACHRRAPVTGGDQAPAPALRTSSKSELLKGTLTLTGSSPGEGKTPEPIGPATPPVEAEVIEATAAAPPARAVAEILADVEAMRPLWLFRPNLAAPLLWELVDAGGEVPGPFRGKMPPRPGPVPIPVGAPAVRTATRAPAAPPVATATTVDLISRLIKPDATERDVATAARKLAEDLDDLHSVGFHRQTLNWVRAKSMPLKTMLAAYKASKGCGIEDRRRIFTNFIEEAKEGLGLGEKTRPGPRSKESRPSHRS